MAGKVGGAILGEIAGEELGGAAGLGMGFGAGAGGVDLEELFRHATRGRDEGSSEQRAEEEKRGRAENFGISDITLGGVTQNLKEALASGGASVHPSTATGHINRAPAVSHGDGRAPPTSRQPSFSDGGHDGNDDFTDVNLDDGETNPLLRFRGRGPRNQAARGGSHAGHGSSEVTEELLHEARQAVATGRATSIGDFIRRHRAAIIAAAGAASLGGAEAAISGAGSGRRPAGPTADPPVADPPVADPPTVQPPTVQPPTTGQPSKPTRSTDEGIYDKITRTAGQVRGAVHEFLKDPSLEDKLETERDRLLSLRTFFPVLGSSDGLLDEQQSDEADVIKQANLLLGMTPHHVLGRLDNPFWLSNLSNDGLRYIPDMMDMPVIYSGGTLTDGATLYGSYRKYPDVPAQSIKTNKRRRIR